MSNYLHIVFVATLAVTNICSKIYIIPFFTPPITDCPGSLEWERGEGGGRREMGLAALNTLLTSLNISISSILRSHLQ